MIRLIVDCPGEGWGVAGAVFIVVALFETWDCICKNTLEFKTAPNLRKDSRTHAT